MIKKLLVNHKWKIGIIFIFILSFSIFGYLHKAEILKSQNEETILKEYMVKKDDIKIDFVSDGEVEIPFIGIDFEVSGKLVELNVSVGQEIKKGEIVAKLEDTNYLNKLKNAEINYQRVFTKLEQTKKQYKIDLVSEKQKLDELKSKFKQLETEYLAILEIKGAYSQQEVNTKKAAFENAKAAYEVQHKKYDELVKGSDNIELEKINLRAAEIELQTQKDVINDTVLFSPVDGKILNIAYNLGETVPVIKDAGQISLTDHFIVVSSSNKAQINVPVAEIDLKNIFIKQDMEIEFEAFEGKTYTGKVVEISSLPEKDSNGLVTYNVSIELDDTGNEIKTGMTCVNSFILKQRKDILVIPNKAVHILDGKQIVEVKDKQGNISEKVIKTGLTDGMNVEVVEGLKVGEVLVYKEKK